MNFTGVAGTGLHRIYRLIRRDFLRKAIALFFAVLIYFYIDSQLNSETRNIAGVPVELELPPRLVAVDSSIPEVTVRIRGDARRLANLRPYDLRARIRIPAESYLPGMPLTLELHPGQFRTPPGITITEVLEPRTLTLQLEPRRTVKLPIRPRFDSLSNLATDYAVEKVSFVPAEVQVSGPASTIKLYSAVYTEPIPLDQQVTESFEYPVNLDYPPGITGSPKRVTAQITIRRSMVTRTFPEIPVQVLAVPGTSSRLWSRLLPEARVRITVAGPLEKINALRTTDLHPYVELPTGGKPGDYPVPVGCYLRPGSGVEVRTIEPDKLTIQLREEE